MAMGKRYKPKGKVYDLVFGEDTAFDGLEVSLRGLSTGEMLGMMKLMQDADNPAAAADIVETVIKAIRSWNLDDDNDQPLPVTRDNVLAQDLDMTLAIAKAWVNGIAGVSDDLGKDSTSGQSFPVVNLPTEALSPSLAS